MPLTSRQARTAHRRVAAFLLIFIAMHFATHFTSIAGATKHHATLAWARLIYQFPLVEIALVSAFAAQIALGFKLLWGIRKRKRKDRWHWIQFLSACYLAYFIIQHTAAALVTRLGFGLDTNFYWAAGTLVLEPIRYWFALYYMLAVIAVFGHLIAALHFKGPQRWHAPMLVLGPLIGIAFVAGYGGAFSAIDLPQEYIDYYSAFPGVGT